MKDRENFSVRNMDVWTSQTIRELAARHHVPQARIIAEAINQFKDDLDSGWIGYPEGWTIPRAK